MSISFKELLGKNIISDVPIAVQQNMEELLKCLNMLRKEYGKPMYVTSGLRTLNHHLRIYSEKGVFPPNVPMKSKHLQGLACDFADPDGSLYQWARDNEDILTKCNIWCELDTKGWLHCQCVPYGSYKEGKSRFFKA